MIGPRTREHAAVFDAATARIRAGGETVSSHRNETGPVGGDATPHRVIPATPTGQTSRVRLVRVPTEPVELPARARGTSLQGRGAHCAHAARVAAQATQDTLTADVWARMSRAEKRAYKRNRRAMRHRGLIS